MDIFNLMNYSGEPMKDLNKLSWEDIDQIGDSGHARRLIALKATKKDQMKDGWVSEWRTIGFDHDDLAEGFGKAPISWELIRVYKENKKMNTRDTNDGGWEKCAMRQWLNEEFFNLCSDELQKVIKPVFKLSSAGNRSTEIVKSKDKIWLKSEKELFGRCYYSVPGEGHWYEVYRQEDEPYYKENMRGERAYQWLRSANYTSDNYFCFVYTSGSASAYSAYYSLAVAPGFCI